MLLSTSCLLKFREKCFFLSGNHGGLKQRFLSNICLAAYSFLQPEAVRNKSGCMSLLTTAASWKETISWDPSILQESSRDVRPWFGWCSSTPGANQYLYSQIAQRILWQFVLFESNCQFEARTSLSPSVMVTWSQLVAYGALGGTLLLDLGFAELRWLMTLFAPWSAAWFYIKEIKSFLSLHQKDCVSAHSQCSFPQLSHFFWRVAVWFGRYIKKGCWC